jgi:CRP-like cAMP-binding protein
MIPLLSAVQLVQLRAGDVLYRQGELKRHVYFPTASYISQISSLAGVPPQEVALVGTEGMVGSSLLLDVGIASLHTVVQGSGSALRLRVSQFLGALSVNTSLRQITNRYLYVRLSQLAQSIACARFHTVEERLARWLLTTRDRARSDTFQMTHEHMALKLGVRRVGITQAAGHLRRQDLIHYRRGVMVIVSGGGLEAVSCQCYAAAAHVYRQQMGHSQ